MDTKGTLSYLVKCLVEGSARSGVSHNHLWYAIRNAIEPNLLISNIAEALRIPAEETENLLIANGFGDIVAQNRVRKDNEFSLSSNFEDYKISDKPRSSQFQNLFSIDFSPRPNNPVRLSNPLIESVNLLTESIVSSSSNDAFLALYRKDVMKYYDYFLSKDAKLIDNYIAKHFNHSYPLYVINSGIGANEQFNHFIAHINNSDPERVTNWLIIDSPKNLHKLPKDASISNTLFMEFSRSGKTEETIKIHEYTPREAKRIVFANSGPLRDIGNRDSNLVLDLPDQVSGRYGRNKTPILLAVMHVAKMDTFRYWSTIEEAIKAFDIASPDNLPLQIAKFIFIYQHKNSINHIYLGCNDRILEASADELLQFWNEGVNKDGNDIMMSRYFGLLRDSHLNIEGILANSKNKLALFLVSEESKTTPLPPLTIRKIDPINPDHKWLRFGDEEKILTEANYQRFSELMPSIKITVHGDLTMDHSAVLGQLWSDMTFCYSKMANVDPGSNPEVKYVRDRSAKLLSKPPNKD